MKQTNLFMNNIVVRIPNHLGDTLMAQPAIGALAARCDNLYLLLPAWADVIYQNIRNLHFLKLPPDTLHGRSGIKMQIDLMKKKKFETGILLTPSWSSARAMYKGAVRRRIGFGGNWRSVFLTDKVMKSSSEIIHRSRLYLTLIERYTGTVEKLIPPRLLPSEAAQDEARQLLKNSAVDPNEKIVALAPQAVAPSRRWGEKNYTALATLLLGKEVDKIILLGTKNEKLAGDNIAQADNRIVNLCGSTSIEAATALMTFSKLFVGNDSGLAHLAAATDIPLVVISGADRPQETSPISGKKTVIIKNRLGCISCVKNVCPKKGENFMRCMNDISVEEIFKASLNYLES